jgi:hypothetical protein
MEESYVAFGLEVRTTVALAGMSPGADPALPCLRLELADLSAVERDWSGPQPGARWRGRLGDGSELTVERGVTGDLRLANADRAVFRLGRDRRLLLAAPRDPSGTPWRRLLLSRILPDVSLACERQALHASAVEVPAGVVAFVGRSGAGKSTLAAAMVAAGALHFSDDVLVLAGTEAHPGSPHLTLPHRAPVEADRLGRIVEDDGEERWLAVDAHSERSPRPVAAIVLLERRRGAALAVERLPTSPLTLAPFMLGLPWQEAREARRFALYSDLVETAALLRLRADLDTAPQELAAAVEAGLDGAVRDQMAAAG